jgi:hypothetical protein
MALLAAKKTIRINKKIIKIWCQEMSFKGVIAIFSRIEIRWRTID